MKKHKKFLNEMKNLKPPVNVDQIALKLGLIVDYLPYQILDGICTEVEGKWHAVINSSNAKVRQRFSLAHEIKHFLEKENSFDLNGYSKTLIEREANDFAGKLLVPALALQEEYFKNTNLISLARKFNVSKQVIEIRLKDLGIN